MNHYIAAEITDGAEEIAPVLVAVAELRRVTQEQFRSEDDPGQCPSSESNPTEPSNPHPLPLSPLVSPSFPSTGRLSPFRHSGPPSVIPASLPSFPLPLPSVRLPLRHSGLPSSFRRKPESRGQLEAPVAGRYQALRGNDVGEPSPPDQVRGRLCESRNPGGAAPPYGKQRASEVTSGDPHPSPLPEGEGILLSVGKRADGVMLRMTSLHIRPF